ncbi:ExbD/TolR family protein [Polynucleobacter victoriensis]|uniref:Biopolymer transport protein ExbD/biopolymer transport protein TolR n=1 Tax=Polynucleobacter victoriensis TaxID=2049319 RepID=A0A212T0K3_9BURK|nr:biopolymer transporter ExbD [Polynucleobacter victoriensis]SNC59294.1 biopolymer transport protein ExbD/biopolymer transport protein TolR [Polynucleobacter victoriensis]
MSMISNKSEDGMMAELNVTPLVDLMLVLLVIFIVTAPLIVPQSMKVNLPKTQAVAQQDQAKNTPLIIEANGQASLNGRLVSDKELSQELRQLSSVPQSQLQISVDKAVPYGRVAEIMAMAQANGVTKLSFVSQASGKK